MDRSWIRQMVYDSNYKKGMKIWKSGGVFALNYKCFGDGMFHIRAQVDGRYQDFYAVSIIYNAQKKDLEECYCDCPAFQQYSGLCKHCVAVLLEADESEMDAAFEWELQSERKIMALLYNDVQEEYGKTVVPAEKKKRKTTDTLKYLLDQTVQQKVLPLSQSDLFGKIRLEPQVFSDYDGIYVRFRVGADKLYVLKDVISFAEAVTGKENVRYGKMLEFVHTIEIFTPESRPMVQFIINWVAQNKERYAEKYYYTGYNFSYQKVRDIYFNKVSVDDFLDAASSTGLLLEESKQVIFPKVDEPSELPGFLTVMGTQNGAKIKLDMPDFWEGNRYFNYINKDDILRIPLQKVGDVKDFIICLGYMDNDYPYIQKEDLPAFCQEVLPVLKTLFSYQAVDFDESAYAREEVSFEIYLDMPQRDWISCEAFGVYGEIKYSIFDLQVESGKRDILSEMKVKQGVSTYFTAYDEAEKKMYLSEDENKIYELLAEGIPWMQTVAEVYISDKLKKLTVEPSPRVSVGVSVTEGGLELTLLSEGMDYDQLFEILSKYSPKKKYYRLKNGNFVNIEGDGLQNLVQMKEQMNLTNSQLKKGKVNLPKYRALYLDSQLQDSDEILLSRSRSFKALIRNMKTVEENDFEVPISLQKILRSYQRRGFRWIKTLHGNGFSGILADDMGLGKTLQVITFLMSEWEEGGWKEKRDGRSCLALIVTPASLVYNWQSEIEHFAPQLSVKIIAGNQGQREEMISEAVEGDILVTSYDLLKRDIDKYEEIIFENQVIDEAQYIKNQNTQAAKAVKQIQSGFRLAMTGTPIENRLSELWSIFDYLMPGFLYSYKRFKEKLEVPIIQNQDDIAMGQLQKMVRPFIMRRLKKDVLRDLPDKLEENVFARIEGEQQKLYDAHVLRMKLLLEGQSDQEFKQTKIQVLAELTKLRQICCDPSLIYEDYQKGSAKLDMCIELIENAVNGGHKILVFSQFTSMLERIQSRLAQEKIGYYTLTGATDKSMRRKLVEKFNADDTSVFCISLKAGGTGLNLTSADIVIHYDPWWNEAVQNQATDRAHRIGQKKVVTVYRLLTKGTIEERIMEVQEKKKALSDKVLSGEGIGSGSFSREELLGLLS